MIQLVQFQQGSKVCRLFATQAKWAPQGQIDALSPASSKLGRQLKDWLGHMTGGTHLIQIPGGREYTVVMHIGGRTKLCSWRVPHENLPRLGRYRKHLLSIAMWNAECMG